MTKSGKTAISPAVERRRTKRRPVLETFSVFMVIPKKGLCRLAVHDISESGMGFDLDIEGESPEFFPIEEGDSIDFRFYLNQSLYIPMTIQVTRISEHHAGRRIGAEFQDKSSASYKAFLDLLHLLDKIVDVLQVDTSSPDSPNG